MYQKEKVDMRVKYTREWTFEALSRLLEKKEYKTIKISEIIIKSGISRATFYRNFRTKDDIVKIKVKTFFEDFITTILSLFLTEIQENEQFLIQKFFKRIDEEEKLVDAVIKTKLEYLMVEGILDIINLRREQFYSIIEINEKSESYTIDICASSAWTVLSRWHRSGKEETSAELANIYAQAFRSVYIALYKR